MNQSTNEISTLSTEKEPKELLALKIFLSILVIVFSLILVAVVGVRLFFPWPIKNSEYAEVYKNFFGVYLPRYVGCMDICLFPSGFDRIPDANPRTFQILTQSYYKDSNRVYYDDEVISNDPSNFQLLYGMGDDFFHFYAKDLEHVYINGKVIQGADPQTFSFLYDHLYEDKAGYYYEGSPLVFYDSQLDKQLQIRKEDIDYISDEITIPSLGDQSLLAYLLFHRKSTRDIFVITRKHESFSTKVATKLSIANPQKLADYHSWATFDSSNSDRNFDLPLYLKDDEQFKYVLTLEGIDREPVGISPAYTRFCTGYHAENGKVYYFQKQVISAAASSFKCKDIPSLFSTHINSAYAIDSKNVYFRNQLIKGADVQTFVVQANPDRKTAVSAYDKNSYYSYGEPSKDSSQVEWLKKRNDTKEFVLSEVF